MMRKRLLCVIYASKDLFFHVQFEGLHLIPSFYFWYNKNIDFVKFRVSLSSFKNWD